MAALEHEVRQLTTRLAGWVEAQLVQALDSRRDDMNALRADLLEAVEQQVAASTRPEGGAPAGEALEQRVRSAMSRLSDSVEARLAQEADNRRAELEALQTGLEALVEVHSSKTVATAESTLHAVQDVAGQASVLRARLDEVAAQAASASQSSTAAMGHADTVPDRVDAFEQRVKAAMGRLTDSVEARLAETAAARGPADEELQALTERLDALGSQVGALVDGMAAAQAEIDAAPARAERLEQRMKTAVSRVVESIEPRLTEAIASRPAELAAVRSELELALARQATELRTELDTAVAGLRARSGQVQERLDTVEQLHHDAGERLDRMVEVKLAEVVDRRRDEMEGLKQEIEEGLAGQVREARTEIGTAVADAHRRFVVSVDRLEERMTVVTEQAEAAQASVGRVELLPDAIASDGRRIEALEVHTRRTDARLAELVDEKLAELAAERHAEVEGVREQLRIALDTHLAEIRGEVATALGETRTEAAAGATRLEERLAALDVLGASISTAQRDAEERFDQALQDQLAGLDAAAAEVATSRAEVAAALAALQRDAAEAADRVQAQVDELAGQVGTLVKAASAEGGALAPLRSDLRLLQDQLAELAQAVAELRPRRKAAPAKKVVSPARKAAAAKAAGRRPQ